MKEKKNPLLKYLQQSLLRTKWVLTVEFNYGNIKKAFIFAQTKSSESVYELKNGF